MRVDDLMYWINERHSIYMARQAGKPKPWTADEILLNFRFCNVYRELDTVTAWIAENWRDPNTGDPNLWFNMVIARLLNWPETLGELKYTHRWNKGGFISTLHKRRDRGDKVFSSAYIVSTNGHAMDKVEYLAEYVLDPLWDDRKDIQPRHGDTLAAFHTRLMSYDGMGSFMAAQVVADVKHAQDSALSYASDWYTWAAPGPGSLRGMNRVMGRDFEDTKFKRAWVKELAELKLAVDGRAKLLKLPEISAQDLQNCLCEFDKYERTRLGEGQPRNRYPGR